VGVHIDLQSVMKDNYSLAVIEDISNGDTSSDDIAKRNHLPAGGIDRAVSHLLAEGIIGGPTSSLHLTEKGKDMLKEMRELEHVPSGGIDPEARSRIPDRFGPEDNRHRRENQGT
jgi:predicted transcriptional regulator